MLIELITCFVLIGIAGFYVGAMGVRSASLAGLAYIVPNGYRTYRMFQYQGARAARLILKGFYQGEALKFGLSVVMFALIFAATTVNPVIFFGTYIGLQLLVWFAPLLIK